MVATRSDMETTAIGGMGNESSIMEDIHGTAIMEQKQKKKLRKNSKNALSNLKYMGIKAKILLNMLKKLK
uniref:Uncharacterized protein n=1 Tax=Caenorhabditis japonica TaxID=281687 RepID=A0A8R1E814_CAEJA